MLWVGFVLNFFSLPEMGARKNICIYFLQRLILWQKSRKKSVQVHSVQSCTNWSPNLEFADELILLVGALLIQKVDFLDPSLESLNRDPFWETLKRGRPRKKFREKVRKVSSGMTTVWQPWTLVTKVIK